MFYKTIAAAALVAITGSSTMAHNSGGEWVLVGSISQHVDSGAGISAEFSSQSKCLAAKKALETHPENAWKAKFRLVCVEK
jgi:hypothetical protein